MIRKTMIAVLVTAVLVACAKVPVSGRKQVNLLPESMLVGMSLEQYQEFLSTNKTMASGHSDAAMVQRVGNRIATAVETYLKKKGQGSRIKDYKWEFNLVQDDLVNAWAMPGGKVVVYSGILPITEDEEGLAVVMGHEVAHAIARHGNERMSQQLLLQAGGLGLSAAIQEKPELTQNLFLMSYGLATNLGSLKFSRDHESEADRMGLVFMSLAGYNPERAVGFWQKMAQAGGEKPPEFLSTHPSDETRIKNIQAHMAEAKQYFKPQ